MITPEQDKHLLSALRAGVSLLAASRFAGVTYVQAEEHMAGKNGTSDSMENIHDELLIKLSHDMDKPSCWRVQPWLFRRRIP
jgi:hypothetical protein